MRERLGTAAELLGKLIGWLIRVDAASYLLQVVGVWFVFSGISGWSPEAAKVALGLLTLYVASVYERDRRRR